jgi:hypothetical protein
MKAKGFIHPSQFIIHPCFYGVADGSKFGAGVA